MTIKDCFLQMQETALHTLVGRASRDEAAGLQLASQLSQTLDNQTQAQLLHQTSHNVRELCFKTILYFIRTHPQALEVVSTMVYYGGKSFRRKLLQTLIADEDEEVMDELIYEHMIQSGSLVEETARKSCADEEFTSCDESSEEQDGRSL